MNGVETQRIRVNRSAWRTELTKSIVRLEDNLDRVYRIVGLKPHRIVREDEDDDETVEIDSPPMTNEQLGKGASYEGVIDEHFSEIQLNANNICALMSSVTEFELPIPVYILIRISARLLLIRWPDFKKKITGSVGRRYVYSKSLGLINTGIVMFKWISTILGSNIIPFQPYINQNLMNLLEWTRTSNLQKHDLAQYLEVRSQVFGNISAALEQLSLNLNLEPKQLKTLIETELVEGCGEFTKMATTAHGATDTVEVNENVSQATKNCYAVDALTCLEKLFTVYAGYLDAPLEQKLKGYVVQACVSIYRDFVRNAISLVCRRQLLQLLGTMANQPYATSTTEIAWHVFELADKIESDQDIKRLARRALKVGLAHRPIIVSDYNVHGCHGCPMSIMEPGESAMEVKEAPIEAAGALAVEAKKKEASVEPAKVSKSPKASLENGKPDEIGQGEPKSVGERSTEIWTWPTMVEGTDGGEVEWIWPANDSSSGGGGDGGGDGGTGNGSGEKREEMQQLTKE